MSKTLIALALATVWGRIQPKQPSERFFRCGIEFGREWKKVEGVDAATKERLEQEQMLEITFYDPTVALGEYDVELTGNISGESLNTAAPETPGALEAAAPGAEGDAAQAKTEEKPATEEAKPDDQKPAETGTTGTEVNTEQAAVEKSAEAKPAAAQEKPADPLAEIKAAILGLDKAKADLWRKDGSPTTAALAAVLKKEVPSKYRDQAWAELQEAAAQEKAKE